MTKWEIVIGLAAVIVPSIVTLISIGWLSKANDRAHAGINERITTVDEQSVRRDDAHRGALESIARDVSYIAGRQVGQQDRKP